MTRLVRVALGIVLLVVAVYYVTLVFAAYGRISPARGIPLSRILGYGLFSLAAVAASVLLLAGKARAASATVLLIFAANYGLYAYWAYVNNQKVFHEAPWSAVVVFVLDALSALVIACLVLKKKAGGLRSLEVFLGVFLIMSVLGYGLAELDRGIYPGSAVASVAETLGLSYLGNAGLREALWHWYAPLFGIDLALHLITAAMLFAGRWLHARPLFRIVAVAAGAIWMVYGSALLQWRFSGTGYGMNLGLGPRWYFYYFLFPTAPVVGALFMTTGVLLILKAFWLGGAYATKSPRERRGRSLTRGIV